MDRFLNLASRVASLAVQAIKGALEVVLQHAEVGGGSP